MLPPPVEFKTGNALLAGLPAEVLTQLVARTSVFELKAGTVLHEADELVTKIFFPISGVVSLLIPFSDGRIAETATIGREGAIGLCGGISERRPIWRAVVLIGGRFAMVRARDFCAIAAEHLDLRQIISRYTETLWAEAQQLAACSICHTTEQRLCRWLLHVADRANCKTLPLTQEVLAQNLGVRRTTVTFLAGSLKAKGAIRYSRGKIEILDRAKLAACTCECYEMASQETLLPAPRGTSENDSSPDAAQRFG